MQLTKPISVRLDCREPDKAIYMKQYDKGSRRLQISLTDGMVPVSIPPGVKARIACKKPDGRQVLNDCSLSGNTVLADISEQMLMAAGNLRCELGLYEGETLLQSATFTIHVEPSVLVLSDVLSSDEYNALTAALLRVEPAVKEAEQATENAKQALANAQKAKEISDAATARANAAADNATNKATLASNAAAAADRATAAANDATEKTLQAKQACETATAACKEAAEQCRTATQSAVEKCNTETKAAIARAETAVQAAVERCDAAMQTAVEQCRAAAQAANTAADTANTSAQGANAAAALAQTNAELAAEKAGLAQTGAELANEKAASAQDAATLATEAATTATESAQAADAAKNAADAARERAIAAAEACEGIVAGDVANAVKSALTDLKDQPNGIPGLDEQGKLPGYLAKEGGTMTGKLLLNADPTENLGAATKAYVDAKVAEGGGSVEPPDLTNYLKLSGGTMTGGLILKGDPTENLEAATKAYVDTGLKNLPYIVTKNKKTKVVGTSNAGWTLNECDYLCDGEEDQIEISQALLAAGFKGKVYLLPGTYKVKQLNISRYPCSLEGITLPGFTKPTLLQSYPYESTKNKNVILVLNHCSIKNIDIDGNIEQFPRDTGCGIYNSSRNCSLENVSITNCPQCLYSDTGIVKGCSFSNSTHGFSIENCINFSNNTIKKCGLSFIKKGENVVIENNKFTEFLPSGSGGCQIGVNNSIITNNIINSGKQEGESALLGVLISGNYNLFSNNLMVRASTNNTGVQNTINNKEIGV